MSKVYTTRCYLKKYLEFSSSYQPIFRGSLFKLHFCRTPNSFWKQLVSGKLSNEFSDKGKSMLRKERARDWNAVDRVKDG